MKHEDISPPPLADQKKAWEKAAHTMRWKIDRAEFDGIGTEPVLGTDDMNRGFCGLALFYGFGDDGSGNADPVLSGKHAWAYARKVRKKRLWQSPHIHFDDPGSFRLRPNAPPRPKGFYVVKVNSRGHLSMTPIEARKIFKDMTCFGPEGLQYLCISHPHYAALMNKRKVPFMVLADYDIAPYGFSDFFDAPQLFCSNDVLSLGIGNIEITYPRFAIPVFQT